MTDRPTEHQIRRLRTYLTESIDVDRGRGDDLRAEVFGDLLGIVDALVANQAPDLARVDRIEVIDGSGRAFTRRYALPRPVAPATALHLQDDERTLKIITHASPA